MATLPALRVTGAISNGGPIGPAGGTINLYTCPANSFAAVRVHLSLISPTLTSLVLRVDGRVIGGYYPGAGGGTTYFATGVFNISKGTGLNTFVATANLGSMDFSVGPGQLVSVQAIGSSINLVEITGVQFGP